MRCTGTQIHTVLIYEKQVKSFVCSVRLCPTDSEIESSVDSGNGFTVEIVDAFLSLGHVVCGWRCKCDREDL